MELPPEDASRPIVFVLEWLKRRGLLTTRGVKSLSAARKGEFDALEIAPNGVKWQAYSFLTKFYDEWYATDGINMAIDPAHTSDVKHLDDLAVPFEKDFAKPDRVIKTPAQYRRDRAERKK